MKIFKIFLLYFIAPSFLLAHGVWSAMRSGALQINYGEGPYDVFYNPKWLKDVYAYDNNLQKVDVKIINKDDKILLEPSDKTQIITILSDNGYWSNGANGWVNKPKDENKGATKGKHHLKMSVNYISLDILFNKQKPTKIKPKPLGLEIEIVPSKDPRFLKQGDILEVQVLKDGKPFKDAPIKIDAINNQNKIIKADSNGKASIKIPNDGFNMIAVETSFPIKDKKQSKKADITQYYSALTFSLKPKEDE